LVEILVAVAIGGALLVTAVAFALSMGELWGNGAEARLFDQHVRGVSRFLENILRQAQPPPPPLQGGMQQQGRTAQQGAGAQRAGETPPPAAGDLPVVWQRPRGRDFSGAELLTFQLAESPGVLAWPEEPLPFVVCALRVDPRAGLFLQWKSRLELDFAGETPREMLVSPFVTAVSYLYFDDSPNDSRWEERPDPRMGAGRTLDVPQRVRLTFEYKGDERTVDLVVPGATAGAPLY
jgi:hypothetical protein